jgi:hypothetical protein
MKAAFANRLIVSTMLTLAVSLFAGSVFAASWDPAAADYSGHKG